MSTQPTSGTSKVILDLQSTIDSLTKELNETKVSLNETKQKYSILSKRNETLVEQLSNFKHQYEVNQSLLKRKERRVLDLENQLTELTSSNDNYRFELDHLKNKIKSNESDKFRLLHENERLTKSYDVLQSSFNDYKLDINQTLDGLKFDIPNFVNKTTTNLSNSLNLLDLNKPEINSNYNLVLKNSKRLEELYSQKYEKVNNYLVLLAESTKQHGQSTSIIMEECEDILKKLNRNEDVLMKIRSETNGNLTDLDKMKEFNKKRDLSILSDSSNIHNSSTSSNDHSSISLDSPTLENGNSNPSSPANSSTPKVSEKRRISPGGLLDSRFNSNSYTTKNENDQSFSTNPYRQHRKRNSLNITKKDRNVNNNNNIPNITNNNNNNNSNNNNNDRRKRNSYRHSMNQDDFSNLLNNNGQDDFIDMRKRINSPSSPVTPTSSVGRSNSTRKNHRNSRNFSANSTNSNTGNSNNGNPNGHNRRWSVQTSNTYTQ